VEFCPILFVDECSSTNDLAKEIYNEWKNEGEIFPLIVACLNQKAGRGQYNRKWESHPYSNITATIIIKPLNKVSSLEIVNAFATNIALYTVKNLLRSKGVNAIVRIVSPNDIYIDFRKVAGILIENIISGEYLEASFVGIGININQERFEEPMAISLAMVCQSKFNLMMCYDVFREETIRWYERFFSLKDH